MHKRRSLLLGSDSIVIVLENYLLAHPCLCLGTYVVIASTDISSAALDVSPYLVIVGVFNSNAVVMTHLATCYLT